jgi:hypothetical protein
LGLRDATPARAGANRSDLPFTRYSRSVSFFKICAY